MEENKEIRLNLFQNILEKEIKPHIEEYEKIRKRKLLKHELFGFAVFFLIIGAPICLYFVVEKGNVVAWFCAWFFIILIILLKYAAPKCLQDIKNELSYTLKEKCIEKILNIFGNVKWHSRTERSMYKYKTIMDDDVIIQSGFFENVPYRDVDDEFEGTYNGVNFKISETKIYRYHDKQNKDNTKEYFEGIIILFESNKNAKKRTIIETRKGISCYTWLPLLMAICFSITLKSYICILIVIVVCFIILCGEFYLKNQSDGFEKRVILEDFKFNRKFNVYSSDQVEARYLITPSFMERLNNLTTAFGCKNIKCSFFNDNFMIFISTKKNLFEFGEISKKITVATIKNFYEELNSIYEMIDYFKLSEKTGL